MKNIYLNGCAAMQQSVSLDREYRSGCASYSSCTDNCIELSEVCSLISRLPADVSLPLCMYAYGYKYSEIAAALNLPMSCVKNRIRAGRIYLKRILDK